MAENTNLMSTYLAREALTLKLAPSNLDGSGDSREFSDYGPLTLRFYSANIFTSQPTTYGFLLNIADGTKRWESHQLWLEQPNGNLYHRGTNSDTYNTNPEFKKILDDSNYADVLDSIYVNVSGDTMTGSLTFTNDNGIYYQGTQASYRMIRFIDNTTDTYGNGISIGGGGQVIIGGGESADAAAGQVSTDGSEIMYICNDHDVLIHSNVQNGWASRKTWTFDTSGNLIIPGAVARAGVSTSWHIGRASALLRMTSISGYSPMISLKTTNGTWDIGAYDYSGFTNKLLFTYITDANFNANNNSITGQIRFGSDGVIEGDLSGNATTASYPQGFSSRSTGETWGNTTGTGIAAWNTSTGGSISFRNDNPSSGKLSIKVDGRFYGNEGTYPAMLQQNKNGYWGMGSPDADDTVWIRTTNQGIIPYQSGSAGSGHNSLGTSSWYFSGAYIDTIYAGTYHLDRKGSNSIYNGSNDAANGVGGALNNLVINSWYGVSFTTGCSGTYQNKNAVSINCRTGYVYAANFTGNVTGNCSGSSSSCTSIVSVKTNLTVQNGYIRYYNTNIVSTSRVFVMGCSTGSTGVVFTTEAGNGWVDMHACDTYNGKKLGWSGTINNINILIMNS